MQKLTKEQGIVLTGFTGFMCTPNFSIFHGDVEKRLGRPIWTHEFASKELKEELKEIYRKDFLAMIPE